MPKYFISHSTDDSTFIENKLVSLLDALKIDYWYSKEEIYSGEQWERNISVALNDCDGLILVMSPSSEKSEWVKDELNWALDKRPGKVIPILYKSCEIENFHIRLPRIQFVDFIQDTDAATRKLISYFTTAIDTYSRVDKMNGVWLGTIIQNQYTNKGQIQYPVKLKIKVSIKGMFEGSVTIDPPGGETYFKLTGGFLFERFIQFSYRNTDPGIVQFGSAVLELDPAGKGLSGKWIGYGAQSEAIVDGTVHILKSK